MRVLIERVLSAKLSSKEKTVEIGKGLLVYVGFTHGDTPETVIQMAKKIIDLRIFSDAQGKLNLNLKAVEGSLLSVSAFTLQASLKKGHRPSFEKALDYNQAELYYQLFNDALSEYAPLESCVFGSDMVINAYNDGPITMVLEG
jgi:D-tyrosyl-tRNA(Tyr) deacylase